MRFLKIRPVILGMALVSYLQWSSSICGIGDSRAAKHQNGPSSGADLNSRLYVLRCYLPLTVDRF